MASYAIVSMCFAAVGVLPQEQQRLARGVLHCNVCITQVHEICKAPLTPLKWLHCTNPARSQGYP